MYENGSKQNIQESKHQSAKIIEIYKVLHNIVLGLIPHPFTYKNIHKQNKNANVMDRNGSRVSDFNEERQVVMGLEQDGYLWCWRIFCLPIVSAHIFDQQEV